MGLLLEMDVESDFDSGVLLTSDELFSSLDDAFFHAASIAMDVHGNSDLVYDFPDRKWEEVWSTETLPIKEKIKSGQLVFVVFTEYEYKIAVEIRSKASENVIQSIIVHNQHWVAVECADYIAFGLAGYKPRHLARFTIPNGHYTVSIEKEILSDAKRQKFTIILSPMSVDNEILSLGTDRILVL